MEWMQYVPEIIEIIFLGTGSWLDVRTRHLPIKFFVFFGILGVLCNLLCSYQTVEQMLLGTMIGIFFLCLGRFTKESIGYGDGTAIVVLGILSGFSELCLILWGAFALCGLYGICGLIFRKKSFRDEVAFFPFLLLAVIGGKIA